MSFVAGNRIFIPTTNAGKLREFEHAFSLKNMECLGLNSINKILGADFSWQTPEEDRETFLGNSYRKLCAGLEIFSKLNQCGINFILVDDSGLCVPKLNFAPGVHSATFAGLPRDDQKNREHLIKKLRLELNLSEPNQESAFFVCTLFFATRSDQPQSGSKSRIVNEKDALCHFESIEPKIMNIVRQRLDNINSAAYGYSIDLSFRDDVFRVGFVIGICTGKVSTVEQELLPGEGHGYDAMFFPRQSPELSFASIPLSEKNKMSHRSEALRGFSALETAHTAQGEILELF